MIKTIHTVAICGIGQMGAAAAVAFQRAGYEVLLWARNAEKLRQIRATLDRLNEWMDSTSALRRAQRPPSNSNRT